MTTQVPDPELEARFLDWLVSQVIADGRGSAVNSLPGRPSDRLWLGRLASDAKERDDGLQERGERLEPTAIGFRFRPCDWRWTLRLAFVTWSPDEPADSDERPWAKSDRVEVFVDVDGDAVRGGETARPTEDLASALGDLGVTDHRIRIDFEVGAPEGAPEVTLTVVNETPQRQRFDERLYEVEVSLEVGEVDPFLLDSLSDSFRYDRRIPAYGIGATARYDDGWLHTQDAAVVDRHRPDYWDEEVAVAPDLRFARLARDPVPALAELVAGLERWGEAHWSEDELDARSTAERWSDEMRAHASEESSAFWEEVARCRAGVEVLSRPDVLAAFMYTNEAFLHASAGGRYDSWRPFQIGFLLATLPSLSDPGHVDREVVDTLWFATGGGKTETYLAAVVLTCFLDRIREKRSGISVWSRFPLRMLSLQQTQRFADALAGAELVRQEHGIQGDPFALGFFVGAGNTPNRVREDGGEDGWDADSEDPEMPRRYQVLMRCPFCRSDQIDTRFDRREWRLVHECGSTQCSWADEPLPFFLVDEEIYRFLPSVVVGTLDKAATLAFQAAMRGFVGSPLKRCSRPGHGFTYSPRKGGTGCLVPGCKAPHENLAQGRSLFAPALRIQDELHLLRDSLGAVDSHYETLLDHLQYTVDGAPPAKVLCSSATLEGHDAQVETLYARRGRTFPRPGPSEGLSPWTRDSGSLARRFVGVAPKGQTLEFANDRVTESLQRAVRCFHTDPSATSFAEASHLTRDQVEHLVSLYGTDVAYGIRIRDVSAAAMSAEAQTDLGQINVEELTGNTPLDDVREVLKRLENPEPDFDERIHFIAASSMMSHGVDIDRLNLMCVLGVPLATAEFIQATARIGRRSPGAVFVLHRMGVERDAGVFRVFKEYVRQGERFVEPIPITRRSRTVLQRTFPGIVAARVLAVHDPREVLAGRSPLSWVRPLRDFARRADGPFSHEHELPKILRALGIEDPAGVLAEDADRLLEDLFAELDDPDSPARFFGELTKHPTMRSLREVERPVMVRSEVAR